jgi:SAM-dependent methyltransferase
LASWNAEASIHGVDISPASIEQAGAAALAEGLGNLSYGVMNVETEEFPASRYDAIFCNSSLHHVARLEEVLEQCATHLEPDGFLFLNEYVGPSRFDFSEREREILRAVFKLLPESHRVSREIRAHRVVLEEPALPDPAEVARVDPSESVRSADILEVIARYFEVIELNELGGAILQFGLANVAGNFTADPNSSRLLDMLFHIEDDLMAAGELSSHFVFAAARPL